MDEIHSPPLFTTSLLLSVIAMYPNSSMLATSPVESQLSWSTCSHRPQHTNTLDVGNEGTHPTAGFFKSLKLERVIQSCDSVLPIVMLNALRRVMLQHSHKSHNMFCTV
eukprot:359901-Pelagomonas_calceolata.AAC.1